VVAEAIDDRRIDIALRDAAGAIIGLAERYRPIIERAIIEGRGDFGSGDGVGLGSSLP